MLRFYKIELVTIIWAIITNEMFAKKNIDTPLFYVTCKPLHKNLLLDVYYAIGDVLK